jgi:Sec-independent protein translocase protein TatA
MEILGVGLPEIGFIVILALILLGPKDMVKAGQTIGSFLRKLVMSPTWQAVRTTGKEIQALPTKLMRDAGLEELREMEKEIQTSANKNLVVIQSVENQILAGGAPTPPQPVQPSGESQALQTPPQPPAVS